jgi:hypothetical protein
MLKENEESVNVLPVLFALNLGFTGMPLAKSK